MQLIMLWMFLFFANCVSGEGFIASTLVKTDQGHEQISGLKRACSVASYQDDGSCLLRHLKNVDTYESSRVVYLVVADELIGAAPDQLFYAPAYQRWIKAAHLQVGDQILSASGYVKIRKVELSYEPTQFFRLSLDKPHTYFVSPLNIVAHNFIAISVAYVIGEGLIWPTIGGCVVSSALLLYRNFMRAVVGDSQNYSFKKFNKPDKEGSSGRDNSGMDGKGHPYDSGNTKNSQPKDPPPKDDFDKYPYGIYRNGSNHGKEDRGIKSREPKNAQDLLNDSLLVSEKPNSSRRTQWESDTIIAVFDQDGPRSFHGHTCT